MDHNQNTSLIYRNHNSDNVFTLDATPCQYPNMESPQSDFMNLLEDGFPILQTQLFQQSYQVFPPYLQ